MTAKSFDRIWKEIKRPTDRKIINAARKHGLKDKVATIMETTGLSREQAQEFEVNV